MFPLDRQNLSRAIALAVALTFALNFLVRLALVGLWAGVPSLRGWLLPAAIVETVIYLGAAMALAQLPDTLGARSPGLGLRFLPAIPALLALALGFFLHGPADFIEAWIERVYPLPEQVLVERVRQLIPPGALARVGLLLGVAVLVPLAEEAFFRGPIFRWLERAGGAWCAIVVTSLCFTFSHGEPRNFPALMLVAMLLGWLRCQTRSLWPCVLLHAAFNATTLLVLFADPPQPVAAPEPSWLAFAIGSAACAALSFGIALHARRGAISERWGLS